ncbi:FkbM family methyltransferase, partial [uncultured Paraglaciecola sp.]|uniref:FkbM family methyltransferase n=1 Tax=uncultured Paraglaciecola sp. TaxID=1765024 RepID=UPI002601C3E9
PNASILLIEPLIEEFNQSLKDIQTQRSCELIGKALGATESTMEISYDPNRPTKASLFNRTSVSKNEGVLTKKQISVTTLDRVLENRELNGKSILLKIDAEGGEVSILKGAEQSLPFFDSIIVEVSIVKRFEESYEFEELISFLMSHGFKLYSFLNLRTVKEESRQRYADILFKKAE